MFDCVCRVRLTPQGGAVLLFFKQVESISMLAQACFRSPGLPFVPVWLSDGGWEPSGKSGNRMQADLSGMSLKGFMRTGREIITIAGEFRHTRRTLPFPLRSSCFEFLKTLSKLPVHLPDDNNYLCESWCCERAVVKTRTIAICYVL